MRRTLLLAGILLAAMVMLACALPECLKDGSCLPLPGPTVATVAPTARPTSVFPQPVGTRPWTTASCASIPVMQGASDLSCLHTKPSDRGRFQAASNRAVETMMKKYPTMFVYAGESGCEYRVKDDALRDSYYWAVALEFEALGYCAQFQADNIDVKLDNTHSESYHVLISNGCVNNPAGTFTWACTPSNW